MSNSNFVFFNGSQVSKSATPKITVRRGGVLILNQNAVNMMGEDVSHVRIAYNPERRAVGVAKAPEDAPGRYRLRRQTDGTSFLVNAKPMFQHLGLTVAKAKSFDVEDFGGGIIGATLDGTLEPEAVAEPVAKSEPAEAAPTTTSKRKKA